MIEDRAALAAYTIHFAYDSAVIRESEQANLQAVAQALSRRSQHQAAHRGQLRRARHGGIQPLARRTPRAGRARGAGQDWAWTRSRIRTISYGKDKPVDPGHDEAAWAKNRRDDFVLLHPKTGA